MLERVLNKDVTSYFIKVEGKVQTFTHVNEYGCPIKDVKKIEQEQEQVSDLQLCYFAISRIIFVMHLYQCRISSSIHIKLPKPLN